MAYEEFAYYYDFLNMEADYDTLAEKIIDILHNNGIKHGIVADLGCGTGEISLRLADAGYDMIAIDKSHEMLCVLREKIEEMPPPKGILLLGQDLSELDLYGTIVAAVSTYDTFNHMDADSVDKSFAKVSLFMEQGGVFIFDANTPYKHEKILADNCFTIDVDDVNCTWQNHYNKELPGTELEISVQQDSKFLFKESFLEYSYTYDFWLAMLEKHGFVLNKVIDGESFTELTSDSQRFLFAATKK